MDPLTLFALANGAVSAVKAGCKLYKDIKSAAGDVKDVLKDLDDQFHSKFKNRAPTTAEKNQFIGEKNRIIDLNKRDGETTSIYQEIGNHLGVYYDNLHKCMAVFDDEERRSKTEIYDGDDSLGKRALQRVLMRKQLEAMAVELREIMVYQMPKELGALYTEVEDLMKDMGRQQKILMKAHIDQYRRQQAIVKCNRLKQKVMLQYAAGGVIVVLFYLCLIYAVILNRHSEYPELGTELWPHRVTDYDKIVAERNAQYWAKKKQEYDQR